MENIGDEYKHYWETNMFLQTEEFDSWGLDEAFSSGGGYYEGDSSSPDGAQSSLSAASKNIVSERNRRKKLNERLFQLRSVVPNISKMDKASIIKDAIDYIQELHDQGKRIQADILKLEASPSSGTGGGTAAGKLLLLNKNKNKNTRTTTTTTTTTKVFHELDDHDHDLDQDYHHEVEDVDDLLPALLRSKKKRIFLIDHQRRQSFDSGGSISMRSSFPNPIEDLELRVSCMGEKTVVVSLTCSKRRDTIVKLCEVFESLKLKIITANITAFSGRLLKTVFVQAEEREKDHLKIRIEAALAALNGPESPMSI